MVGLTSQTRSVILTSSLLPCTLHVNPSKIDEYPLRRPYLGLNLSLRVQLGSQSKRQVQMTMIHFRRTGGSMGREMAMDFDLGTMPGGVSQRLQSLLTESIFFDIPVVNDLRTSPDEYQYDMTVVAGNSIHTIHISDTSMPESLRPLVEELTELTEATA